jgi:hypothetical protein
MSETLVDPAYISWVRTCGSGLMLPWSSTSDEWEIHPVPYADRDPLTGDIIAFHAYPSDGYAQTEDVSAFHVYPSDTFGLDSYALPASIQPANPSALVPPAFRMSEWPVADPSAAARELGAIAPEDGVVRISEKKGPSCVKFECRRGDKGSLSFGCYITGNPPKGMFNEFIMKKVAPFLGMIWSSERRRMRESFEEMRSGDVGSPSKRPRSSAPGSLDGAKRTKTVAFR